MFPPIPSSSRGWSRFTRNCPVGRGTSDAVGRSRPKEARSYLEFVEEYTQTPAAILSIGPDRDETIIVRPDLIWAS
jgi:adenylosuccinate synthase